MVLYNDKWASERKDTLSQTEIRSLSCIVRSQKEILIVSATGSGRFPGGEILGCLICAGIGSVFGCFNLFVCLLLYVLLRTLLVWDLLSFEVGLFITVCMLFLTLLVFYYFFFSYYLFHALILSISPSLFLRLPPSHSLIHFFFLSSRLLSLSKESITALYT